MKDKREAAQNNEVCLRFLSRSENVSLARLLAAAFVADRDMTVADLDEIKVVVSEAVSNCIIHGYEGRENEWIELRLTRQEHKLLMSIEDSGVGIADIERAMQTNYSTVEERMGLGFAFMTSFMDTVEVVSAPGQGTTVTMSKNLL